MNSQEFSNLTNSRVQKFESHEKINNKQSPENKYLSFKIMS